MAKEEKKETLTDPKIRPELYWEWRCTIEELKTAKLNEKRVHLERELMNKEIENKKLRIALFRETVSGARKGVSNAEAEYENMKKRIEKEINMSLDGCVIDDISYEVRKLEDEN